MIHTNSSLTCFRRCPREYEYRYVQLRVPIARAAALRFGSLWHVGQEAWWASAGDRITDALAAMGKVCDVDPFDLAKASALMIGYHTMWSGQQLETVAVELRFEVGLEQARERASSLDSSPESEESGDRIAGAIDAIARDDRGGVHVVEHKTTSLDISQGSDYWRHVDALDPQVSTYLNAARQLGYDPRDVIYDVVRKPAILPLKATPEDQKKYTKPTAKDPVPRLYANQRETDETPEEYRARVIADIAARPQWYYARRRIVRLDHDNVAHATDTVLTVETIRYAKMRGFGRSPSACERYGRLCDYHDVCSGIAPIDDARFRTKVSQHEELA